MPSLLLLLPSLLSLAFPSLAAPITYSTPNITFVKRWKTKLQVRPFQPDLCRTTPWPTAPPPSPSTTTPSLSSTVPR